MQNENGHGGGVHEFPCGDEVAGQNRGSVNPRIGEEPVRHFYIGPINPRVTS